MATPLKMIRPARSAACWRLDRKGCFVLRDSQRQYVTLHGRKARAIIAYLGAHCGERISRERLIELLWADRGDAQARGSLRQSLVEIRRAARGLISSDHDYIWIESARLEEDDEWDRCVVDEQLFDDLDDITPEFDAWLRCVRSGEAAEEWSELKRKAEDRLARQQSHLAMPLIDRMRAIDPYNEDWLRLAMEAERQAAHPAGIQQRFLAMDELLKRELGVSLSAQTRALHDRLLEELSEPEPEALVR